MAISLTSNNRAFAPGYNQDDLRNLQGFKDNPNNTYYRNRYNEIMLKRNPNFFDKNIFDVPRKTYMSGDTLMGGDYGNPSTRGNPKAQYNPGIQQNMMGSRPIPFNTGQLGSPSEQIGRSPSLLKGAQDFDNLYTALTLDGTYDQSDVDSMLKNLQESILGGRMNRFVAQNLFTSYSKPAGLQSATLGVPKSAMSYVRRKRKKFPRRGTKPIGVIRAN